MKSIQVAVVLFPLLAMSAFGQTIVHLPDGTITGLNNSDVVTGYQGADNAPRGFISDGTSTTYLPTLGGAGTMPYGINDRGEVAGWSFTGSDPDGRVHDHAFLYSSTGIQEIGNGGAVSYAYGIRPITNTYVGVSTNIILPGDHGDAPDKAYLYSIATGSFTELPQRVFSVNNNGQALLAGGGFWDGTKVTFYSELSNYLFTSLNDAGQVSFDSGVLDTRTGSVTRLLSPLGSVMTADINSAGQVVGVIQQIVDGVTRGRPFFYSGGTLFDLLPLMGFVPSSSYPYGSGLRINDEGAIYAKTANGNELFVPGEAGWTSLLSSSFDAVSAPVDPVTAPAPIPGTGLLSIFCFGLAWMKRQLKRTLSRYACPAVVGADVSLG